MVQVAGKHAVYYVAEEHLQLQGCTLVAVLGVLAMHLLVNSADCVAIAHLEFGEVLVFGTQSLLEIRDCLLALLHLLELLVEAVQLDAEVSLYFREYFDEFGVAFLVLAVVPDAVLVEEVEEHLVDVKLEC